MKQPLKEMLKAIGGGHLLNERVGAIFDRDKLLDKKNKKFAVERDDIENALKKDRKIAKHIGKADIDIYFDDLDLVAGGDAGETIVSLKWNWTFGDLKKAILKKNPKKWQGK